MKNSFFLSKLAGIILLLVVTVQIATAGNPQTPYQQLQNILDEYGIEKYAVTDELTGREVEYISIDVAIRFKVPESVVTSATTIGEMLTNILTYQYAEKKGEEWEWKKIQYSSNSIDYDWFLRLYPKSKHSVEAISKYMVTRLHEVYISLAEAESVDEVCDDFFYLHTMYSNYYDRFIRKHKCGGCGISYIDYEGFSIINPEEWAEVFRETSQMKAEQQRDWKAVIRENTHDAYFDYCLRYPQCVTVDTAIERIKRFEQTEWDKALEIDNRDAYEVFVKQFPKGYYSIAAYRKIVSSHLDTTSTGAVEDLLTQQCQYGRQYFSLLCIGNIFKKDKHYTVTLSGDLGYRLEIGPGEIKWQEVLNGDYLMLVEAEGEEPWWGEISCYGYIYVATWYVKNEYHAYSNFNTHRLTNLYDDPYETESFITNVSATNDPQIDRMAAKRFVKAIEEQCEDY